MERVKVEAVPQCDCRAANQVYFNARLIGHKNFGMVPTKVSACKELCAFCDHYVFYGPVDLVRLEQQFRDERNTAGSKRHAVRKFCPKRLKRVVRIDPLTKEEVTFGSAKEAAKKHKTTSQNIWFAVHKCRQAAGYYWKAG